MNKHTLRFYTLVVSLIATLGVSTVTMPAAAQSSHETITAQTDLTTAGTVTTDGAPLAMGDRLVPPGGGDGSDALSSAGQGSQRVSPAPGTAGAIIPADPGLSLLFAITALMASGATAAAALLWRHMWGL